MHSPIPPKKSTNFLKRFMSKRVIQKALQVSKSWRNYVSSTFLQIIIVVRVMSFHISEAMWRANLHIALTAFLSPLKRTYCLPFYQHATELCVAFLSFLMNILDSLQYLIVSRCWTLMKILLTLILKVWIGINFIQLISVAGIDFLIAKIFRTTFWGCFKMAGDLFRPQFAGAQGIWKVGQSVDKTQYDENSLCWLWSNRLMVNRTL